MLTALRVSAEITEDGILQISAPVVDMVAGLYEAIVVVEDRQPSTGLTELAVPTEEWDNIIPLHPEDGPAPGSR